MNLLNNLLLLPLLEIKNPFDGVTPSLGPFEDAMADPINKLLGLVWFACLVLVAVTFATSLASARKAGKMGRPQAKEEAMESVGWIGLVLAFLAMLPAIVGVFLAFGN